MARSEKFLLALASLFFAGTFGFGFLGMLKAQYRSPVVMDAEKKLYDAWRKRSAEWGFLEPGKVPEFRQILVPGTQAPFSVNADLIGANPDDVLMPASTVALYESHPGPFNDTRCVIFVDGHFEQLSPEKWEEARSDSGIVESPTALRPWWKFWQSGPREFFPREAFAALCIELWLSFCVLNAICFGRWAGAFRGFGRFWFSLTASFVCGLGLGVVFAVVSAILRL